MIYNNEYNQFNHYRKNCIDKISVGQIDIFELEVTEVKTVHGVNKYTNYNIIKIFKNKTEVTELYVNNFRKRNYIVIYSEHYNMKSCGSRFTVILNKNELIGNSIISEIKNDLEVILDVDLKKNVNYFMSYNNIEINFMNEFLFELIENNAIANLNDRAQIEYIKSINDLKMYIYLNTKEEQVKSFISGFVFNDSYYIGNKSVFFNWFMKVLINNCFKDKNFANLFIKEIITVSNEKYKDFDSSKLENILFDIEEDEDEHQVDRRKVKLKMKQNNGFKK